MIATHLQILPSMPAYAVTPNIIEAFENDLHAFISNWNPPRPNEVVENAIPPALDEGINPDE